MDNQTKIGIGAAAMLTLAGVVAPIVPWWVSAPIMAACATVAGSGLWPWIRTLPDLLSIERAADLFFRVRHQISGWGVQNWQHPYSAQSEFGDTFEIERLRDAEATLGGLVKEDHRLRESLEKAIRQHGRRGPSSPMTEAEAPEIALARAAVFAHQEIITSARSTAKMCEEFLQSDITAKLSSGALIAKGLPLIDGQAQRERVIPAHQWRVLEFDFLRATAQGHGLSYVGIVIGKPRRRR
jgi:hypothetical protein